MGRAEPPARAASAAAAASRAAAAASSSRAASRAACSSSRSRASPARALQPRGVALLHVPEHFRLVGEAALAVRALRLQLARDAARLLVVHGERVLGRAVALPRRDGRRGRAARAAACAAGAPCACAALNLAVHFFTWNSYAVDVKMRSPQQ